MRFLYDLPPDARQRYEEILQGRIMEDAPRRPKSPVAQCGTWSGYKRHLREKTPTCQACKDAATLRYREYKERRKVAV